jgi:hypothetical protein
VEVDGCLVIFGGVSAAKHCQGSLNGDGWLRMNLLVRGTGAYVR